MTNRRKIVEQIARAIVKAHAPGSNDPDAKQGGWHDVESEWYDEGDPIIALHDMIYEAEAALDVVWPVVQAAREWDEALTSLQQVEANIALITALSALDGESA